jgi:hypothetical protein
MVNRSHGEIDGVARCTGMTSVHGFCSDCGAVNVPLSALSVELPDCEEHGSYSYVCPSCAGLVREPAGRHLAEVLVAFGAPVAGSTDAVTTAAAACDDGFARVHFFAA